MTSRPSLGTTIRARRRELGLTQEALAERISAEGQYLRQSDISRLERDEIALPRRARLESIACALGLTIGELLARSGWAKADVHLVGADDRQHNRASSAIPGLAEFREQRRVLRAARQELSVQATRLARNHEHFRELVRRNTGQALEPLATDPPPVLVGTRVSNARLQGVGPIELLEELQLDEEQRDFA